MIGIEIVRTLLLLICWLQIDTVLNVLDQIEFDWLKPKLAGKCLVTGYYMFKWIQGAIICISEFEV